MRNSRIRVRHEHKYIITPMIYKIITDRLSLFLPHDSNSNDDGAYRISSLYFDDIYGTAYGEKHDGIANRQKFRIRCYNNSDKHIKLECKGKLNSYVYKESEEITREQYDRILSGDLTFLYNSDSELLHRFYQQSRTRGLSPNVIVDYVREAYISPLGNTRITFDTDIKASTLDHDLFSENQVLISTLDQNNIVMEVKYDEYLPPYLNDLISGQGIILQPVSKYILCLDKKVEVKHHG